MNGFKEFEVMDGLVIDVGENGDIRTRDNFSKRRNGRPYNRKGIILKPAIDKSGYKRYTFSHHGKRKSFYGHRLVALAYLPNVDSKPTVNHINGIKTDNRVENLEWATNKEQKDHAIKNHLCDKNVAALAECNKRKSKKIVVDGKEYYSLRAASKELGHHAETLKKKVGWYK